ncbi:hypothetical protein [Peribacillus frigoritolerans]|uniref:hypothetical protein n=1 Tax=Peribacillus frigoritolerans TaxID=450367 RepID=UPI0020BE9690|nr:hypothetical protein [Peribacillus frigoritolerans]
MTRKELFNRIIEEKQVIDPVIWLLRIQFTKVDEEHEEYVRAMAERYKNNPKVMKQLEQLIELWKIK